MFIFPSATQSGYLIQRSLRFRSAASAYLARTPASAGSRTTWTYSAWVKRGVMDTISPLFYAGADASNNFRIQLVSGDTLAVTNEVSGVATTLRNTTQVFRDPSAWYHIVVALDTTQATAANRLKVYVNGLEVTAFASSNDPTQNYAGPIGNTVEHRIGLNSGTNYFDGYQTEVQYVNGQALTPSAFGEFDSITNVWKPKKYTGTYGTNGFYLNFRDNSATTAAAIGKDSSGNGNNWTPNNISLTAGVTYDSMTDVPTLTGPTAGNFCVLNSGVNPSFHTYSDGNLKVVGNTQGSTSVGTIGLTVGTNRGKWYWEATFSSIGGTPAIAAGLTYTIGTGVVGGTSTTGIGYGSDGLKYNSGSTSAYGATYAANDVIGTAFDAETGQVTFYKNGVSQGLYTTISAGSLIWLPAFTSNTGTLNVNFGQRPFAYTPPAGFKALCTTNLPDSTITAGDKHMNVVLRTASGTSGSTVSSLKFRPDFIWDKSQSISGNSAQIDSVRGASKYLQSTNTNVEATDVNFITSFNSNGFTIGSTDWTTGTTVVDWCWKAGDSVVTNTSGSITSQVNANTTAGFSIVTYTGTGVNATVGHGLGVAPSLVIVKRRELIGDWNVRHSSLSSGTNIRLNSNSLSSTSSSTVWNSTLPTATVFSIGTSTGTNASTGTYVAYCFTEVPGFSRFASYTGNGSLNGPFVHTGFRPRFVMIKLSSSGDLFATRSWYIYDSARNTFNVIGEELYADLTSAAFNRIPAIDFLSNGFKLRTTEIGLNKNADVHIYVAFAENPFKNSLAR